MSSRRAARPRTPLPVAPAPLGPAPGPVPGALGPGGARPCGFAFTTTGRPCANLVAPRAAWCRAGHPCAAEPGPQRGALAVVGGWGPRPGARTGPGSGPLRTRPPAPGGPRRAPGRAGERCRRAAALVREAVASEDTEGLGLRADQVLADPRVALGLLGGPEPWPVARQAVVQHYGLVGAYLVVGFEERGAGKAEPGSPLERLVRHFATIELSALYRLLGAIEAAGVRPGRGARPFDPVADSHRWLHATYALAARDGTAAAHRTYMRALDDVMRQVRPVVAS
ncbi:MAG TPA: hypothetical protein VMB72_12475 [Acidimicrobiales bacterium]|nr:hypothetical protein [Acidimicrobiales bacterium]